MKTLIKVFGIIVLIPALILFGRVVYLQVTIERNTKTYENEFISFQYPADLVIRKAQTWDTHEALPSGIDPYGMTMLSFEHTSGGLILNFSSFNELNVEVKRSTEERAMMEETLSREAYPGSLKSLDVTNNGLATSIVAVYCDNTFLYRGEIISATYITPLYTHVLEARWQSGTPLFDWYGRKIVAHNLVDTFVSSFKERQ